MPGCSLVVQVAEWSSSVGCWWSLGPDPLAGPAAGELAAEFPLNPDGLGRAVAWLEQELRRPVVERVRGYGVARRRTWAVVMDDHYQLLAPPALVFALSIVPVGLGLFAGTALLALAAAQPPPSTRAPVQPPPGRSPLPAR
jgi:hypothetical protein